MIQKKFLLFAFTFIFVITNSVFSQNKTKEETLGFAIPFEIGQGFNAAKSYSPQLLYLASLYIKPSYTFSGNKFGIGATGMLAYTENKVSAFGGPQAFLKIYPLGSPGALPLFKIYLTGDAMWGSEGQRLFGGGLEFRANPIFVSLNARQENKSKSFWFDASAGLNLNIFFKKKVDDDPTH